MPEIVKAYREHMPALRLIGKRYTDGDRDADGSFMSKWAEWFRNGWFGTLEALGSLPENEGAYLGCMSVAGGFYYWIGMFFPKDTPVPAGFQHADIPAGDVGMCWICGRRENGEIFGQKAHDLCVARIQAEGWEFEADFAGSPWPWFFERYQQPRFTAPDAGGNVILDYGIYIKPEPGPMKEALTPEGAALVDALNNAALANGCSCRIGETEQGRTIMYSARNLKVNAFGGGVSLSGEYDIRAFLRLYRQTGDDMVRRLLFDAAIPCCYCIDDKCTTLLMAKERTIEHNGRQKKLCGPYRHQLSVGVTVETLSACIEILNMMLEYTYTHMHGEPAVPPNDAIYTLVEKDAFYILGYVQKHSPVSPTDEAFVASLLKKDDTGRRKVDALLDAAGPMEAGRYVGATENFVNGACYDFLFGTLTDRRPAVLPEGAVCRKVCAGEWAVYNSASGDYKGIWRHFTERFYPLEHKGYDDARIPFEYYDGNGQLYDVHIPVDADIPAGSGRILQVLHTPDELLAGFENYAETDYPLYRDRPFDELKRIADAFPHGQCLVRVSIHSLFGKPLMGFDGVAVDGLSVIPEDFERYKMQGGYWRRLGWKHFNGEYQGWGEAIEAKVDSAVPLNTMHHPRGFNEYRYQARGGYSEIGIPIRLMGKRSFEAVELVPRRVIGKREAPPESIVTEEDVRRFYDMPENALKGAYVIAFTLAQMKQPNQEYPMTYYDKPLTQGVFAEPDTATPEGLAAFTLDGGAYVKVTEDFPNGVLGWEFGEILGGLQTETGLVHDGARQFIYVQYDRGSRYAVYVPVQ